MKRTLLVLTAAGLMLTGMPMTAQAGPATDKLSQCLIKNVTESDKISLIQWVFSVMAKHPQVAAMANISTQKQSEIDKKAAAVFTKLLAETCTAETKAAIAAEGQLAVHQAFSALGQVAMMGLMSDPAVANAMNGMLQQADMDKLSKAFQ